MSEKVIPSRESDVNISRKRKLETKGWAWEFALGLSVERKRGNRSVA